MKLSILITLLNEELVLSQTHQAISEKLEGMLLSEELSDYEILYIDDGSSDKTLELIDSFARENQRVKYISFSRNFGRESGILAGFKYATGEAFMVMDGDWKHTKKGMILLVVREAVRGSLSLVVSLLVVFIHFPTIPWMSN